MESFLADNLRLHFGKLLYVVTELRIRLRRPLAVRFLKGEVFVYKGDICPQNIAYVPTERDIEETLDRITEASLYAFRQEFKQGFLMLPGGHRVGVVGEISLLENSIHMQRYISSLNIRLAKDIPGAARPLYNHFDDGLKHTVIVGPPGSGKTTVLRDLIRFLAGQGFTIGVIDERGEIAACLKGTPEFSIGATVDILTGCPKKEGFEIMLRGMRPDIIATDEIGFGDDYASLEKAGRMGVKVLASWHGLTLPESFFELGILLGTTPGEYPLYVGRVNK